jgi:hypothetical protein
VKNRFQILPFKCNLQCYTPVAWGGIRSLLSGSFPRPAASTACWASSGSTPPRTATSVGLPLHLPGGVRCVTWTIPAVINRCFWLSSGVALTPGGCQMCYMGHTGCHQLNAILTIRPTRAVTHSRVSHWFHGIYRLSSFGMCFERCKIS